MLTIKFIPLSQVELWERNPKKHDLPKLIASLTDYGFQLLPKFDSTLGGIIFGNGRITALRHMKQAGKPPPAGIALDEQGEWLVPIFFGNDLPSKAIAEAFALDHNNLVLSGGGFSAVYTSQIWNEGEYVKLLLELSQQEITPVTVDQTDISTLMTMIYGSAPKKGKKAVNISMGKYVAQIPPPVYEAWAEEISLTYEFDTAAIETELKRRLRLTAVEERFYVASNSPTPD